jgi:hypothetical protein
VEAGDGGGQPSVVSPAQGGGCISPSGPSSVNPLGPVGVCLGHEHGCGLMVPQALARRWHGRSGTAAGTAVVLRIAGATAGAGAVAGVLGDRMRSQAAKGATKTHKDTDNSLSPV